MRGRAWSSRGCASRTSAAAATTRHRTCCSTASAWGCGWRASTAPSRWGACTTSSCARSARGRERLLVSGAVDFARWPVANPGGAPIAWLAPALAAEVPQSASTLERPVLDLLIGTGAGESAEGGALGEGGASDEGAAFGENGVLDDGRGGVWMRCWLNAPRTVGQVLRAERLGSQRVGEDDRMNNVHRNYN